MQGRREAPPVSRSLIVALRVFLLVLAGGALAAAVLLTRDGAEGGATSPRFACPMHPEVTASEPGQCPICRMALEPSGRNAASTMASADMAAMADVTAVENVRKHRITDFVRKRSLLPNVQEIRGPAWVESDRTITAVLYVDQLDALAVDERASFSLTQAPKIVFAVHRTADPAIPWDRSTSRARFELDANRTASTKSAPEPGQVGWLEAARRPREVLAVPASAVLQGSDGPYVLVASGGPLFEKRPIEIGETLPKQGFSVVLAGLRPQERVVSKAAFFLDADRRLSSRTTDGNTWAAP
jgi:hypothetical protein